MDRGSLSDAEVLKIAANARCLLLKIQVDVHPEYCKEYRVPNPDLRDDEGYAPYPALQVWTPSGVLVDRSDGLVPPPLFRHWLSGALEAWPAIAKEEQAMLKTIEDEPNLLTTYGKLAAFYTKHKTYRMAAETWMAVSRRQLARRDVYHKVSLQAGHAYLMYANYEKATEVLSVAAEEGAVTRERALYFQGFSSQQAGKTEKAFEYFRALLWDYPAGKWAPAARKAIGKRKIYY